MQPAGVGAFWQFFIEDVLVEEVAVDEADNPLGVGFCGANTATSTNFKLFSETMTVPDPTTDNGDVLILRIFPASGVDGAVTFTNSEYETSFIKIPPVK